MKIVSVICPHCGATLQTASNTKMLTCDYCKNDFMVNEYLKKDKTYSSPKKVFTKDKVDNGMKPINDDWDSEDSTFTTLLRIITITVGLALFLKSGSLTAFILISFFIILVICLTK